MLAETFPFVGYINQRRYAHSNILKTVQKHLPHGGTILDFGSGPCDTSALLQFHGYQCSAYDDLNDDWHCGNRGKIFEFTKKVGIDFRMECSFPRETFDMVMLHDVLEHLHDSPRLILNDLMEFLKPEGLLYITVPSAVSILKRLKVVLGMTNLPPFKQYYFYPGHWRGHIREYVYDDLVQLVMYLSLDPVELKSIDHMLQAVPPKLLPFYRAITALIPSTKDSWQLVARKPHDWKRDKGFVVQT